MLGQKRLFCCATAASKATHQHTQAFKEGKARFLIAVHAPPPPPLPHTYNIHSVTCTTAQAFKEGEARFLIATDVGARGLDISGLPYVINMTLPDRSEDYIHR